MSTVNGGVAGSIASQASQTLKQTQSVNATSKTTSSFAQRTAGSVFGAASGNFGALAMMPKAQGAATDNTRVAAIGAAYKNAPQSNVTAIGEAYKASAPQGGGARPPQRNGSTAIGQLLGGGFGQMTAQGRTDRQGLMTNPSVQTNTRNTDQDQTKTSDEMLEIANNLTMKDMWAAA